MALTAKMRKFAQAVVNGLSNKDAAISAGYAEKTASQQGSRLIKDPEIQEYIEKLKAEEALTFEDEKLKAEKTVEVVRVERVEPKYEQAHGQFVGRDEVAIGSPDDPLEYLKTIWMDERMDEELRIKAAQIAMPYIHGRVAPKGKKQAQADDARNISGGSSKFATRAARKQHYS